MSEPPADSDDLGHTVSDVESQSKNFQFDKYTSYKSFSHRAAAFSLRTAAATGVLGTGPREPDPDDYTLFSALLATMPWFMLIAQALWSSIFTAFAYAVADKDDPAGSLSTTFWSSRLTIPSTVAYGVGWALFVLLGFFIREASARYNEALVKLGDISDYLVQTVRHISQVYPEGTWHPGDRDRLVAHLVAYPIALKMTLRREREAEQLAPILHPDDIDDVISADYMHIHCMRVVRAYLSASEDDQSYGFKMAASSTPAGWGTRYFLMDIVDAVDLSANSATRIADFRPAVGYVNHLRIFLYIWLFFLPMVLIESSGWFTALFSVLITYGVGMLFTIAHALNEPYGYDMQDIKLNRYAATCAARVLSTYSCTRLDLASVVKCDHHTPQWLEQPKPTYASRDKLKTPAPRSPFVAGFFRAYKPVRLFFRIFRELGVRLLTPKVFTPMLAFIAWIAFVVFVTWGIARRKEVSVPDPTCRWWCTYIPIDTSTTAFVSLGIFLLIGFWMNDAYGRYWRGLQIWQTSMRINIEEVAYQLAIVAQRGVWHNRDRERIFSHLVALPYATKLHLRNNRDVSELEGILSTQDLVALAEAENLPAHCFHVLYGYFNSLDSCDRETLQSGKNSIGFGATYSIVYTMWSVEHSVMACNAIRFYPISKYFTTHLKIFTAFWLALLPLSTVKHDGFLSFLYLIPIGYSIINLVILGMELADPFGYDENDIPLDTLCEEIKNSIHHMYHETANGHETIVQESGYAREAFVPQPRKNFPPTELEMKVNPTVLGSLKNVLMRFPTVPVMAQVGVTIWALIAVVLSYSLSHTWSEDKRSQCRSWCSPIDVDSTVLGNIGFALFMILSFRASDAISRYDEGASMIYDMEMFLRNLAVEAMQFVPHESFHRHDKERIVAFITQIPLCFRDMLLKTKRDSPEGMEGLLSPEDRAKFESSESPMEFLLQTIEAYILVIDLPADGKTMLQHRQVPTLLKVAMLGRVRKTRAIVARACGIKRFPVVRSYTNHQRLFTLLWLALLPLGMAPVSGWFTILWAPIVSYAVFGLESLAVKLVDPYGEDRIDIPVDDLCTNAANTILEAANEVDWDCVRFSAASSEAAEPRLGTILDGQTVHHEYTLAHFEKFEANPDNFGQGPPLQFKGPGEPVMKPSLYAHFLRSVPWWVLLAITVWTAIAVIISFVAKTDDTGVRWWNSRVSVDVNVAAYVSFAAFMLLGFYVQAAFGRYHSAGSVWGDSLRAACHATASQWLTFLSAGSFHEGDNERVLAHIASVPIALKLQLRDSRDVRELKGLLSPEDLANVQCANNMCVHLIDVIRAYFLKGLCHSDRLNLPPFQGNRASFIMYEIHTLESAVRLSLFLKNYAIAPGFIVLLNTLVAIWFILLPFVLAEISGWLTILWVPIIAYGLLGMYSIAAELQQPFGTDLNDLDLDRIANSIVADVLFVQKHQSCGTATLVRESPVQRLWQDSSRGQGSERSSLNRKWKTGHIAELREMVSLGLHAVSPYALAGTALWAGFAVGLSFLVSKHWEMPEEVSCGPWWCSRIAVAEPVKEYIGFALFLLLGFWLYDSHRRYVLGLRNWQDGVIGYTRLLTNRTFECFKAGTWHEGDLERIAGHVAAFSIMTVGKLRGEDRGEQLEKVVSAEDVERILSAEERGDYCLDVVRGYFIEMDRLEADSGKENTCGVNVHWMVFWYVKMLRDIVLDCEQMVRVPMPFGYVEHLKIFTIIWLALLPLGLVESTGWVTILWIVLIAYGVAGIETWAEELSDPFGHDRSDVPLDALCERVVHVVRNNLKIYANGSAGFIFAEREGFPQVK